MFMRLLFLVFLTTSAIFLSEKPDVKTNTGLVLRPSHRHNHFYIENSLDFFEFSSRKP